MKAGEAKPYFDALQADLESEPDPQLRSWYETETTLTPEYRDADALRNTLEKFRSGLAQIIEKASSQETAQAPEAEAEIDTIDEVIDVDEWLTPQQRKQKSVLAWLGDVRSEYSTNVAAANSQTKKSKRDKQLEIADNRFASHFEQFGDAKTHIVYDAEALGYVLDELQFKNPRQANLVVDSSRRYMHRSGMEFAGNPAAFAGIIRGSLEGNVSAAAFDRILSSIYEKRNFVVHPKEATQLCIDLAHTVYETTDGSNLDYYHKILEIAYLQNDIITQKAAYQSAIEFIIGLRDLRDAPVQLIADTCNARSTFSQAARAYENHYDHYHPEYAKHNSTALALQMVKIMFPTGRPGLLGSAQKALDKDFFANPQHYDPIETFDLETGELMDSPNVGKVIPERWRQAYTSSELYRKRTTLLAPRALVHDMIKSTSERLSSGKIPVHIVDIPISPGVTLSIMSAYKLQGSDVPDDQKVGLDAGSIMMDKVMEDYADNLDYERFAPTGSRLLGAGFKKVEVKSERAIAAGIVIARPSVPEDLKNAEPHLALSTALRWKVHDYIDRDRSRDGIEAKKDFIRQNRHNYFGRRPIKFRLPDSYRSSGLVSVVMRQHPDRAHILVEAQHAEGNIPFVFDMDLNYSGEDPNHPLGITALQLAFEDLVVSLASEWACRPVVETSEGKVSAEDNRSKVNLGFLRYLPAGHNFRPNQLRIFRLEQRGNLAAESMRRKPLDPTGRGRNSTYQRENYDPSRPPLEVYYDPSAIQ